MTYAVTWRDDSGAVKAGRLELDTTGLRLEAASYRSGRRSVRKLLYRDIVGVEMASYGARLGQKPTIAIRGVNESLYLAPVGAGLAREVLGLLQLAG